MMIQPNSTTLEGTVTALVPEAGGAKLRIAVHRNTSKGATDFVKAAAGTELEAFTADPGCVEVGRRYKLKTTLLGGPGGQRLILQEAKAMKQTG